MTGDDDLAGRIEVGGNGDLAAFGNRRANFVDRVQFEADQRRHRALPRRTRFLHQTATLADRADRIGEGQRSGRNQRAVLAEAVPGGDDWSDIVLRPRKPAAPRSRR